MGFPGETDEDFAETLSMLDEAQYDGVFGFKYSPRPNTPSLALNDPIPEEIKGQRLARIQEKQRVIQTARNLAMLGQELDVFVSNKSTAGESVVGAYDFESRDKFLFPRAGASGKLRARKGDGKQDGEFDRGTCWLRMSEQRAETSKRDSSTG